MDNVVYEVSTKFDFSIFKELLILVAIMAVSLFVCEKFFVKQGKQVPFIYHKNFLVGGICFVIVCTLIVFFGQLSMYNRIVGAYQKGEYEIVEGYVENFTPEIKKNGDHRDESFDINGVHFFYSMYDNHPGYHRGGIIRKDGMYLKIGYVYLNNTYGNIIVYVEIIPD